MRICEPQNQFGQKLVSVADFTNVSLRLEKTLDSTGIITLTAEDISDIELWEVSSVAVKIDSQYENILPETFRNTDGSLSIRFFEATETVDFSEVVVILKHTTVDGVITKPITIEMKIAALMAKTIADSKKPDYDRAANIAEWKALGVEAKTTEPDNYPYADCSTAADLTAAGFDLYATTIGKDVCLISFDSFNNTPSGGRRFIRPVFFEADLPSVTCGDFAFYNTTMLVSFTGRIPNVQTTGAMFKSCTGLREWTVELPSVLYDTTQMFYGCSKLTEFSVNMPSGLSNASSMFYGCKLNKASVQRIVNSIPDVREVSGTHNITIGIDSTQITQAEQDAFNTTITGKGWTVTWQRN